MSLSCHSRVYLLDDIISPVLYWTFDKCRGDNQEIVITWSERAWSSTLFMFSGGQHICHASCQGDGWTNARTYPFFMVSTLVTNKYRWKMTLSGCVTVNYPNLRATLFWARTKGDQRKAYLFRRAAICTKGQLWWCIQLCSSSSCTICALRFMLL